MCGRVRVLSHQIMCVVQRCGGSCGADVDARLTLPHFAVDSVANVRARSVCHDGGHLDEGALRYHGSDVDAIRMEDMM